MYGTAYDEPGTTRVPAGEADYLAKAAEQLAKVTASLDRSEKSGWPVSEARQKAADQYAALGAIQRGQLPASLARVLLEQLNGTSRP